MSLHYRELHGPKKNLLGAKGHWEVNDAVQVHVAQWSGVSKSKKMLNLRAHCAEVNKIPINFEFFSV